MTPCRFSCRDANFIQWLVFEPIHTITWYTHIKCINQLHNGRFIYLTLHMLFDKKIGEKLKTEVLFQRRYGHVFRSHLLSRSLRVARVCMGLHPSMGTLMHAGIGRGLWYIAWVLPLRLQPVWHVSPAPFKQVLWQHNVSLLSITNSSPYTLCQSLLSSTIILCHMGWTFNLRRYIHSGICIIVSLKYYIYASILYTVSQSKELSLIFTSFCLSL